MEKNEKNKKNDLIEQSIIYLSEYFLFTDKQGTPYICIDGRNLAIDDRMFKANAYQIIHKQFKKRLRKLQLEKIIQGLSACALQSGHVQELTPRYHRGHNEIHIDCYDGKQLLVKNKKVEIITLKNRNHFTYSPNKSKLKYIFSNERNIQKTLLSLIELFPNLNFDNILILLTYLVYLIIGKKPYPILIINGEQGSGKTKTSEFLKSLIDPGKPSLRTMPSNSIGLFLAAKNDYYITFDNLSGISKDMADNLCRISTGGSVCKRKLYTDSTEVIIEVSRPILLNGINELSSRPDLLDRSILLETEVIEKGKLISSESLDKMFEDKKDDIFSGLVDIAADILDEIEGTFIKPVHRIINLCKVAKLIETKMNYDQPNITNAIANNKKMISSDIIEGNEVTKLIANYLSAVDYFKGTVSELFFSIEETDEYISSPQMNRWPQNSKAQGNLIRRLTPVLRDIGISIIRLPRTSDRRELEVTKIYDKSDVSDTKNISNLGDKIEK